MVAAVCSVVRGREARAETPPRTRTLYDAARNGPSEQQSSPGRGEAGAQCLLDSQKLVRARGSIKHRASHSVRGRSADLPVKLADV